MNLPETKKISSISFFLLSVIAGIIILYPQLSFQSLLSQGDHGQNLYAFQQTYRGFVPYKDYWSGYGPFAPYYYSIFFHLFGENIASVLIGQCLLILIGGLFFYGILSFFAPPLLAIIASIWFWAFYPDFFYTYNHAGAFPLFMAIAYFAFHYINTGRKENIYWGIFCTFLLALIRINMGICLLVGFIIAVFLTDFIKDRSLPRKNKLFYILPIILVPLVLFIIYGLLTRGLPDYAIRQSFPYGNKFYYSVSLLSALRDYLAQIVFVMTGSWHALVFTALILLFILRIFRSWTCGLLDEKSKRNILLTLSTTILFLCFVSHEYFLGGVSYRIVWTQPFEMLLLFLIIAFGTKSLHDNTRLIFYFAMLLMIAQSIFTQHLEIRSLKIPRQYITLERAQIYTANPPQWIQTVEQTTQYLESHLSRMKHSWRCHMNPFIIS